ncbi:MAG: hypothetical protein JWN18_169 [Parcubacteria group bacterium]|nr:hypothetical protein [Parcubacteria group bacterium]
MERWQSGRMHWFRKPAGAKAPRGFKSHPLRSFERSEKLRARSTVRGTVRVGFEDLASMIRNFLKRIIRKVY